jgi:cobalt/nickel transport system ATP-binding protein
MISIRGLCFSYPEAPVLRDLDFSMEAGEAVALIGPNGSGKSSLLKVICGLLPPEAGTYSFQGEPVTAKSMADQRFAKSFHKRVGLLFQDSDAQLFCGSVRDEIAFGPRQMGLGDEEVASRVDDLLGLFELKGLENRVPYHLSGGEKRKVALASALALGPELLCLDEPMGALDPRSKRALRELIASLNASGMAMLCATHDFEYVRGLFGRAIVLSQEGRVVREGGFEDIVADRRFLEAQNIL